MDTERLRALAEESVLLAEAFFLAFRMDPRNERFIRDLVEVAKACPGVLDRLAAAERERDALAALLRECRDELQWCSNAMDLMPDDVGELLNRIDAALDGAKEKA